MIRKELNMGHYEIMWQRSWTNIEMMLADQAKMVKVKKQPQMISGAEMAARSRARRQNG